MLVLYICLSYITIYILHKRKKMSELLHVLSKGTLKPCM